MFIPDVKNNYGVWQTATMSEENKRRTTCSYAAWCNMRERCKPSGEYQQRFPTYIGCSISEEWGNFQDFANWFTNQIGYGLPAYCLDKDLLIRGNKIYSPSTCSLIPGQLNKFLNTRSNSRGLYPQGVYLNRRQDTYRAVLRISSKKVHIGYYKTPEAAYNAYKKAKEGEAKRWASRLKAGEFIVDGRVIAALENWTLK